VDETPLRRPCRSFLLRPRKPKAAAAPNVPKTRKATTTPKTATAREGFYDFKTLKSMKTKFDTNGQGNATTRERDGSPNLARVAPRFGEGGVRP
jgi:hypothetical protein